MEKLKEALSKKHKGVFVWLGVLLIVTSISCALVGGLMIDRGFGPSWLGIILMAVALLIAASAYARRVTVLKKRRRDVE